MIITSPTKGEGGYVFTPFCLFIWLFVNCRNPSDFGNCVGRLCVILSVCLFVCLFTL